MRDEPPVQKKQNENWWSGFLFSMVHLLSFGMLYLVLVQINWSFQDFYKLVGTKLTPEFERIALISNYIAAYTPLVLLVVGLDIFIVLRLARNGSRWMSAYSHAVLLCIGFTGFLWTARSVEPMVRGLPGGNPPAVNHAQAIPVDGNTLGLQSFGEPLNATERRRPNDLVVRNSTPADTYCRWLPFYSCLGQFDLLNSAVRPSAHERNLPPS